MMKKHPLGSLCLLLLSLLYIGLFTYLVALMSMQWFDFDMLREAPAVVITVLFAASTLFASPLIPRYSKWLGKSADDKQTRQTIQ